jgi:hypothetical protein
MIKLKTTVLSLGALMLSMSATAGSRELSYAVEDAAYQAVQRMSEDPRVGKEVKKLAFVKLWQPAATGEALSNAGIDVAVFESALGAVPCGFDIVLHANRDQQWELIDQVFDQAADFESYNPSTHPEFQKLELCDSMLLAKVVGAVDGGADGVSSVRLALKIIQVKTARQVWSAVIEGQYDGRSAPDNERLSYFARKALEAAAADAVAKLPASLDGYGVMIVPLQGPGGRAMTQIFMNALTASGRHESVRLYDLPNGNASDRMLGRFLWERTGSGKALDPAALKRVESRTGAKGKLAVMTGMVVAGRVFPETWVDPTGAPVDRLTGSYTDVRKNPTSFEITADLKFRDIGDSFRVVAAVSGNGVYKRDVGGDIFEQLRAYATVRNIAVAAVLLLVIWFICRFTLRVR